MSTGVIVFRLRSLLPMAATLVMALVALASERSGPVTAPPRVVDGDSWTARCEAALEDAQGRLDVPSELSLFAPGGGVGFALHVDGGRYVAGVSGVEQPGVVDRDWYDLNHQFGPADVALADSAPGPLSLFKDHAGRSAFFASRNADPATRARFFQAIYPALDACMSPH